MLPSSGPISFRDINVELGRPAGNWIDLNDAGVRALAGRPSGYIDFADLRGKSSSIFETFSFYVGEVGPQQIGDKVIISEPHRRGYFMYATDAYGYESARAGGLSPATYRGYTVDSMVEQHGTATVDTLQVLSLIHI